MDSVIPSVCKNIYIHFLIHSDVHLLICYTFVMHPLYGVISDVDKWSSGSYKADILDFPGGTVDKNPPANAGDAGSILGPGRSHTPQSNEAQVLLLLSLRARSAGTEACVP